MLNKIESFPYSIKGNFNKQKEICIINFIFDT